VAVSEGRHRENRRREGILIALTMDREARMNLHCSWRVPVLVLLLLGVAGLDAFAQVPTGTIAGTVKDSQGFSIPGATVLLTNEGTARTQAATTSSRGAFQFTHINFGVYKVEVSKAGFKISVVDKIKLDASTEYSVPPITLEIGAVTDTVTIEADANLVRTAGAELTDTVERTQIEELPILDRNPMNLLELQAGVSQNRHASGVFVTVINGQRQSFSNFTLDGINIQDNYVRSASLDYTPNNLLMSQVEEFTTTTQNAGPQAGVGSSQVSVVTPSGNNNWHGEGFWYYRTTALAANDWFNDANGIGKPNLLQNQAGGMLAGGLSRISCSFTGHMNSFDGAIRVPQTPPSSRILPARAFFNGVQAARRIAHRASLLVPSSRSICSPTRVCRLTPLSPTCWPASPRRSIGQGLATV